MRLFNHANPLITRINVQTIFPYFAAMSRESRASSFYVRFLKRLFDFIFVLILLVIVVVPFIVIMILYFFTGEGRPFFSQLRVGYRDKSFNLYKFRTLSLETSKSLNDRRFGLGNFLRKTSLDELPQLLNVLMGDMSFVGPRPLPLEYLPL